MRATLLFSILVLLVSLGCIQSSVVPEIKCNDSEASADIYHYGYVTYNGLTYADSCQGTSRMTEYYCRGDGLQSEVQDCPSGYACSEGACMVVPCVDSDNGNLIAEKGTITKGEATYTDYCVDESVVEYYCANNEINSIISRCPGGYACIDGACTFMTCADSESGRDASVAGTVTKDNKSYADYCSDSATVFEYYCGDSGEVASTTIGCSSGYACSGGICILGCSDSDGGQDRYVKGTASNAIGTSVDGCSDANTVLEYYCSGDMVLLNYLDCPSGYACSDGKCVSAPTCIDTDGSGVTTKTTATFGGDSYTDYCKDSRILAEYMCLDGNNPPTSVDYSCGSGRECSDGRCISVSCTDSDGQDIYTYGHVTKDSSTYYDSCTDSTHVKEYWCNTDNAVTIMVDDCPMGYECSGGRCISGCTDTDGGQDAYTHGTVWVGDASYSDRCLDVDMVTEYYCSGGGLAWTTIGCDLGYACSSGVCVAKCEETDSGNDPKVAGTTARGTVSYDDTCIDRSTLREYYCLRDMITETTVACTAGCNPGGSCNP
ncbi:hypothetical protein H0O02_05565 [Candidatus Micrarchaeota archaeon]|nr:hypothetical protein [Candidatus Micrarchaeota archaeon]